LVRSISSYLLVAFLLLAGAPQTAWADEVEDCLRGQGYAQIQGCSTIISTKKAFGLPITRENLAIAYFNRGNAYVQTANDDNAIADFTAAIELNPDDVRAYMNRGNAYARKNRSDLALEDFNAAIKIDPKFAKVYLNRGSTFFDEGEYTRAIADYDITIALDPKDATPYRNFAWLRLKKPDRAITDFGEALKREPADAQTHYYRGNAYDDIGKYAHAITDYDEAIRLKPDVAYFHLYRGIANDNRAQYAKAVADYDAALKLNPNDSLTHNNRGNSYLRMAAPEKTGSGDYRFWRGS